MADRIKRLSNYTYVSRFLVILISLVSLLYFTWWLDLTHMGNPFLYTLLVIGEIYHVFQAVSFALTIYELSPPEVKHIKGPVFPFVDVYITVCGEPAQVVEETVSAAVSMDYPNFKVYVLNDGYVAKKGDWADIEKVAKLHGAITITRTVGGGFKAGNINNALKQTDSPFIVMFDADHKPYPQFLKRTMGYFEDPKMALVQTPQYYANRNNNFVTKTAWEQQELFFGPICVGKNRNNAAFWCGTSAVVRRTALESIGGIPETSIAEDFLASLFIHQKGWNSLYVPEILSQGFAPFNLNDYVKQQYRWARGSLEIIFKYNPIFKKGLTWRQKWQYISSASFYLNGVIIAIDALIPIVALGLNLVPVQSNVTDFIVYFMPFLASTIYLLTVATRDQITFSAIQFTHGSFFVYLLALFSTLFGVKSKFEVTPKSEQSGNYLKLVIPHIFYIVLGVWAVITAVRREGFNASVINNTSWVIFNITMFTAFIRAAYDWQHAPSILQKLVRYSDKEDESLQLDPIYDYVQTEDGRENVSN